MIGALGGCGSGCGFTAGVVEDVLLVPINISYDRIVEQSLVKDELMVGHCSVCVCACVCVCREGRRDRRHSGRQLKGCGHS